MSVREATASEAPEKLGFLGTVKTFPSAFYLGCGVEMFERLSYYGVRTVLPLYIAQADDPGGLHFGQAQKATIFATFAAVQAIVPAMSGGFADRYGYKRAIATAVTLNVIGYVLMANVRSYPLFFASYLLVALGTAIFKPGIQGSLAQSLSKKNSSVGWGLFYWLVNVGGAAAPLFGAFLRSRNWQLVFYGSALAMAANYVMLFTYKDVDSGADKKKSAFRVLVDTLANLKDLRLLTVIFLFLAEKTERHAPGVWDGTSSTSPSSRA